MNNGGIITIIHWEEPQKNILKKSLPKNSLYFMSLISTQLYKNYRPCFKGFTFLSSIGLGLCPFKSLSLPGLAYLGNKSLQSIGLSKITKFDH